MCDDFWVNCQLSLGTFPGEVFATSRTADRAMQRKVNITPDQFEEYMRYEITLPTTANMMETLLMKK